jgi:putative effector of murein hydrolase
MTSPAPKSVAILVAMAIARDNGGSPALTALLAIPTVVIGANSVTPLMNVLGLKDYAAPALPPASRPWNRDRAGVSRERAGRDGLAIALNGLGTSLLLPALFLRRR